MFACISMQKFPCTSAVIRFTGVNKLQPVQSLPHITRAIVGGFSVSKLVFLMDFLGRGTNSSEICRLFLLTKSFDPSLHKQPSSLKFWAIFKSVPREGDAFLWHSLTNARYTVLFNCTRAHSMLLGTNRIFYWSECHFHTWKDDRMKHKA